MNASRRVTGLIAGAVLLGFVGAVPAHAEGSRDTYFTLWRQGEESSRWQDNNRDSVTTSVKLRGCSTDGSDGFRSATLKLWKNRDFYPDDNKGSRTNRCGTSSWGDESSGKYYFELSGFTSGSYMSANKVYIKY